jgi:hypothetical protein
VPCGGGLAGLVNGEKKPEIERSIAVHLTSLFLMDAVMIDRSEMPSGRLGKT